MCHYAVCPYSYMFSNMYPRQNNSIIIYLAVFSNNYFLDNQSLMFYWNSYIIIGVMNISYRYICCNCCIFTNFYIMSAS